MSDLEKPQISDAPSTTAPTTPSRPNDAAEGKAKPGQHWKENEEHVLPPNRLGIVFFGLMSCTFLAALDQVCFLLRKGLKAVFTQGL